MEQYAKEKQLVIFSPLPPKENGIADYVHEQLAFLSRSYDITVVVENNHPKPLLASKNVIVLTEEEYLHLKKFFFGALHIYHVGNNPDHEYMIKYIHNTPGILILHDFNLHHLFETQTIEKGNKKAYLYSLWNEIGISGKTIGDGLVKHNWKSQIVTHGVPMNSGLIKASKNVVVHSRYSLERVNQKTSGNKAKLIPHHLSPKAEVWRGYNRERAKRELNLPADKNIVTSLGFINKQKQIPSVLRAIKKLTDRGVDLFYVLAGKCRQQEYDVYKEIKSHNLENFVRVTGYLSEEEFFRYVSATDIVINLRYPIGGETSGTLTRALGMGRCSVVVDLGPFSEIPDECVYKIPWSDRFSDDLEEGLYSLASNDQARKKFEKNSRKWIAKTHNISHTVSQYSDLIENCSKNLDWNYNVPGNVFRRHAIYPSESAVEDYIQENHNLLKSMLAKDGSQLWWRERNIPYGQSISNITVISDHSEGQPILMNFLGYSEDQIKIVESNGLVTCDERYLEKRLEVVLLIIDERVWRERSEVMLGRLNDVLAEGGYAVLNLKLIDSGDNVLGSDIERLWRSVIEKSGFTVMDFSEDAKNFSFELFERWGKEMCWRLRKVSSKVEIGNI